MRSTRSLLCHAFQCCHLPHANIANMSFFAFYISNQKKLRDESLSKLFEILTSGCLLLLLLLLLPNKRQTNTLLWSLRLTYLFINKFFSSSSIHSFLLGHLQIFPYIKCNHKQNKPLDERSFFMPLNGWI